MFEIPFDEIPVSAAPISPSAAQERFGTRIYGLDLMRRTYGMEGSELQGRGATVALLSPGANPHVAADVNALSAQLGAQPPEISTITYHPPPGRSDPDPDLAGVRSERKHTSAVAQAVHAMAPQARLLLVEVPYLTSAPEMLASAVEAMEYMSGSGEDGATVALMACGYPEPMHAQSAVRPLMDQVISLIVQQGTTVLAATGIEGPTELDADRNHYPSPTVCWPASHPEVTAVGGARLHLDDQGQRGNSDEVWSAEDDEARGMQKASGGGRSELYERPAYQDPVAQEAGPARAVPDLVLNGSGDSRVYTRDSDGGQWAAWAGTGIAAALMAGITACAAGARGHGLGNINPVLYRNFQDVARIGLLDLVEGETSANGVQGHAAQPGYDLASGLGAVQHGPSLIQAMLQNG